MSWEDKLKNTPFRITTGDGKVFTPLWVNGESSVDFNIKKYEFINVEGSMVERKTPQATNYPLTFYFQGADNVDKSKEFIKSANDKRAWEVNHPFYGTIIGQPTSLQRIDDSYNVTRFVVGFWETITEDYPKGNTSARDQVLKKVGIVNGLGITNYVSGAKPKSADIATIKENSKDVASKFDRLQTQDTYTTYKNVLATCVKSVDNIIASPGEVIDNNQKLLMLPSTYDIPVLKRINAIRAAYLELKAIIKGKNDKYYFESQAATAIAGISEAAVNPQEEDYVTRDQVNQSSAILLEVYNDYLETVDNAQVSRYDTVNEWSPNVSLQQALYDLFTESIASLYQLAFGAKQERIVEVMEDSNLFLLTHRYMGLDVEDKNLELFRNINNIKNDELFKVKKGRKIKYFV
tara:strand:+ start:13362 stop:14579 length:1218 start_codon:yes stop_codon:yes gene_type:complete